MACNDCNKIAFTAQLPLCETGTIYFCASLIPNTAVIIRAVKPSGAAFEFDTTTDGSGGVALNWPNDVPDHEWFSGDVLWFVLEESTLDESPMNPNCSNGETLYAMRTQSIPGDTTNPPFTIGCQC